MGLCFGVAFFETWWEQSRKSKKNKTRRKSLMYDWELADDALKTWIRLRQACDCTERVLETGLRKYGATLPTLDVLSVLSASRAPVTPGDIALYVAKQQHTASAQLSRMMRAGYVRKLRNQMDQRVVSVKIRPKGEDLLEKTRQVGFREAERLLKTSLSDKEMEQLDNLLKKVRDRALKELGVEPEPLPKALDTRRFLSNAGG